MCYPATTRPLSSCACSSAGASVRALQSRGGRHVTDRVHEQLAAREDIESVGLGHQRVDNRDERGEETSRPASAAAAKKRAQRPDWSTLTALAIGNASAH